MTPTAPPDQDVAEPDDKLHPLITALTARAQYDTTALPMLRRTLRTLPQVQDPRVWPLIAQYSGGSDAAMESNLLTACLWARWQERFHRIIPGGDLNLGAALRRALPPDDHVQAYNTLCAASWPTLARTLTPLVVACADRSIPLNWNRLSRDIRAIREGHRNKVYLRWSASMFNPSATPAPQKDAN